MVTLLDKANIPLEKQMANPAALLDIRPKMQAVLSQFSQLNQYAQKSIVAYLRTKRVIKSRRIRTRKRANEEYCIASGEKISEGQIGTTDNSDEDDNVLVLKRKDVFDSLKKEPEIPDNLVNRSEDVEASTSTKVITKLAAAKKLLNKKVKANVKKVFDEDGELIKVDGAGNHHESAGLDLPSAVESLKKDSAEDKKRYKALMKERKKAEKERLKKKSGKIREDLDMAEGGSGIDSDADLSFLPDPDEVRKRYRDWGTKDSDDDEQGIPTGSDKVSSPLRKRRMRRKELIDSEKQALALLNPF
ncbi:hypothetical protein KIN20_029039 [Parelaphostrongylus tenuis]|uniref:Uncharacterized protein n=1 Tax=Parelaphostrongylus tenuis TaxID=148309 RepID=A0AAD5R1S5_PARTN|nr:hypothetical protein KIN20_029039 [Parelaphostrongylus tenuis]